MVLTMSPRLTIAIWLSGNKLCDIGVISDETNINDPVSAIPQKHEVTPTFSLLYFLVLILNFGEKFSVFIEGHTNKSLL